MTGGTRLSARLRSLPLLWKLLVPPTLLTLLLGLAGGFLLVRTSAQQAEAELTQTLFYRSVTAQALLRDIGAGLQDTTRLAASVEGIPESAVPDRRGEAARLLLGIATVQDVDLLALFDENGTLIAGFQREGERFDALTAVAPIPIAAEGLAILDADGRLWIVATTAVPGRPAYVMAGTDAAAAVATTSERTGATVALSDGGPHLLGPPALAGLTSRRVTSAERALVEVDGRSENAMIAPLEITGLEQWNLTTALPASGTAVWGPGIRLGVVLIIVLTAVVSFGALLARAVNRQVSAVLVAKRAIASGDLSARAPVLADDELGELARGLNAMASELETTYHDLERQVAVRTAELVRVYEAVADAGAAHAEFVSELSHDLRTPLTAIMANAEMLADPALRPSRRGWSVESGATILSSAQHMQRRVEQVLAQVRSGGVSPLSDVRAVHLHTELDGIERTMSSLARSAELELTVDVPADLPLVLADPARLHEIVLNLVSNAAKYTPAGGRVVVSAQVATNHISVAVRDTGPGISKAAQARLFEPFYRVPGVAPRNGTSVGLGLALTRRLVEAHGGRITVRSVPGEGSVFAFTMPLAPPAPAVPKAPVLRRARGGGVRATA